MRTMFRAEQNVYNWDRGSDFERVGEYKNTMEEAKALVIDTPHNNIFTGDYRIIAVTMDEATFTMTEEIVFNYNYYKEIGKWADAEEKIARYKAMIAEIEASKKRVRTEKGMEKKNAEIAMYRKYITDIEEAKKKWAEEK